MYYFPYLSYLTREQSALPPAAKAIAQEAKPAQRWRKRYGGVSHLNLAYFAVWGFGVGALWLTQSATSYVQDWHPFFWLAAPPPAAWLIFFCLVTHLALNATSMQAHVALGTRVRRWGRGVKAVALPLVAMAWLILGLSLMYGSAYLVEILRLMVFPLWGAEPRLLWCRQA